MNALQLAVGALSLLCQTLLPLVLVGLFGLATWSILGLGGLLREWGDRRRAGRVSAAALPTDRASLAGRLAEAELHAAAALARAEVGVRLGPVLGLMGTLIPLGPALRGLARGDLEGAISQLVVAFSTTVVGLLISAVAFCTHLARRSWYARDLADLEAALDRAEQGA